MLQYMMTHLAQLLSYFASPSLVMGSIPFWIKYLYELYRSSVFKINLIVDMFLLFTFWWELDGDSINDKIHH